jgi:hypothetical protein
MKRIYLIVRIKEDSSLEALQVSLNHDGLVHMLSCYKNQLAMVVELSQTKVIELSRVSTDLLKQLETMNVKVRLV